MGISNQVPPTHYPDIVLPVGRNVGNSDGASVPIFVADRDMTVDQFIVRLDGALASGETVSVALKKIPSATAISAAGTTISNTLAFDDDPDHTVQYDDLTSISETTRRIARGDTVVAVVTSANSPAATAEVTITLRSLSI